MGRQAFLFKISRGYELFAAFKLGFCLEIYGDSKIRRSETPVVEAIIRKSQSDTGMLHVLLGMKAYC
jgi:hypothetical protein